MSKKERPKIYQHTSGGGHELIHNNPSPKELLKIIKDEAYICTRVYPIDMEDFTPIEKTDYNDDLDNIEQTLTNYANMVEMLEGLREKYDGIHKSFGYPRYATVNPSEIVADITKVLEGK
jgi:hypothetical protein